MVQQEPKSAETGREGVESVVRKCRELTKMSHEPPETGRGTGEKGCQNVAVEEWAGAGGAGGAGLADSRRILLGA